MHVVTLIESKQKKLRRYTIWIWNYSHKSYMIVYTESCSHVEPYFSREEFFAGSRSTVSLYSGPMHCMSGALYIHVLALGLDFC